MRKVFAYIAVIVLFFQVLLAPLNLNLQGTDSTVLGVPISINVVEAAGTQSAETSSPSFWQHPVDWMFSKLIPDLLGTVMNVYAIILHEIIIPLIGRVLDWSSRFFNSMLDYSLDSATFTASSYSGQAIQMGWILIRDFLNIVLIFLLLFAGIKIILSNETFNQKFIVKVVVAGLLVNFSLFFTQALVDVSNIVTINLKNSITQLVDQAGQAGMTNYLPTLTGSDSGKPVANVGQNIAAALGLFRYYQEVVPPTPSSASKILVESSNLTTAWIFIFLMCFAIYIFFKMGLMFLTRTIILSMLMITSPIWFIGPFIPKLNQYTKQWEEFLTGQLLFAPIFLVFLYVVMKMINSPMFLRYMQNGAHTGFAIENFTGYFLIMGLLYAGMKAAKDYGGAASEAVLDIAKKGIGTAVGATAAVVSGGTAFLARGAAARVLADKGLQATAAMAGPEGDAARRTLARAESTAKRTFNFKDTFAGKGLEGLGIKTPGALSGATNFLSARNLTDADIARASKYGTLATSPLLPSGWNKTSAEREDEDKTRMKAFQEMAQKSSAENEKARAADALKSSGVDIDAKAKAEQEVADKIKDVDEEVKIQSDAEKQRIESTDGYVTMRTSVDKADLDIRNAQRELKEIERQLKELEKNKPDPADLVAVAVHADKVKKLELQKNGDPAKGTLGFSAELRNATQSRRDALDDYKAYVEANGTIDVDYTKDPATGKITLKNVDANGKVDLKEFDRNARDGVSSSRYGKKYQEIVAERAKAGSALAQEKQKASVVLNATAKATGTRTSVAEAKEVVEKTTRISAGLDSTVETDAEARTKDLLALPQYQTMEKEIELADKAIVENEKEVKKIEAEIAKIRLAAATRGKPLETHELLDISNKEAAKVARSAVITKAQSDKLDSITRFKKDSVVKAQKYDADVDDKTGTIEMKKFKESHKDTVAKGLGYTSYKDLKDRLEAAKVAAAAEEHVSKPGTTNIPVRTAAFRAAINQQSDASSIVASYKRQPKP